LKGSGNASARGCPAGAGMVRSLTYLVLASTMKKPQGVLRLPHFSNRFSDVKPC
jgi:hypothetical protein